MKIRYKIKNFKSFSDSGDIEFSPITLLCGVNSAGKSSIIKSILLTKQSSLDRRSSLSTAVMSQPLILNGELTKLGSWGDTITNKIKEHRLGFSWSVDLTHQEYMDFLNRAGIQSARTRKKREHSVEMSVTLSSDPQRPEELSIRVDGWELKLDNSRVTVDRSKNIGDSGSFVYRVLIKDLGKFVSREGTQVGRYGLYLGDVLGALKSEDGSLALGNISVNTIGPFFGNARPIFDDSWSDFFDSVLEISERHRGVKRGPRPKWIDQLSTAARAYRAAKSSDRRELTRSPTMRALTFLAFEMVEEVSRSFLESKAALAPMWRDIRYLGPLRDQPRRFYQFDDTGGADVGVSGEFTVQVLAIEQAHHLAATQMTPPPKGSIYPAPKSDTLLSHTNHWLSYMALPHVSPQSLQQSLYKLEVGDLGVGLLDVGFGVSQVLPIIVESLRARPGELVILEQPEIHLHPKVQAQLADFLIARSRDGVRFLVESHSEYLIKRLCRRVAESEDPSGELNSLSSIYFVEGSPDGARCNRVSVNEFGEIENWPRGFFDLDEDLHWTKASLQKRRKRKLSL